MSANISSYKSRTMTQKIVFFIVLCNIWLSQQGKVAHFLKIVMLLLSSPWCEVVSWYDYRLFKKNTTWDGHLKGNLNIVFSLLLRLLLFCCYEEVLAACRLTSLNHLPLLLSWQASGSCSKILRPRSGSDWIQSLVVFLMCPLNHVIHFLPSASSQRLRN